jgi:hypothetical protein
MNPNNNFAISTGISLKGSSSSSWNFRRIDTMYSSKTNLAYICAENNYGEE